MRRVVCSAVMLKDGNKLPGPRHWDMAMRDHQFLCTSVCGKSEEYEQGFVDQWNVFMSRREAWQVAEAAGQILKRCGGDDANGGTLYSENLY